MTNNVLTAKEYLYLETFCYSFMLFLFIVFNFFNNKKESFDTIKNLQKLQIRDIMYILITSIFFIYTTLMIYENEHNNSAFMNSLLLRGGTLIGILLVGIFFYNEKYNWKQILGIILSLLGIYLLMCEK
jgi:drug/metabolite transporter (DMT)-like permease